MAAGLRQLALMQQPLRRALRLPGCLSAGKALVMGAGVLLGLLALLLALASWMFERQLDRAQAVVPQAPLVMLPTLQATQAAQAARAALSDNAAMPSTQLQQGAYIARLGNCSGCHTARGGAPYAGGRVLTTPFGSVVASNLTPDIHNGLGRWSSSDLWRALQLGRARNGRMLLPVCPYNHYSHITRADNDALHSYLHSLQPVATVPPPHALHFPYSTRAALALWRLFYFRPALPSAAAEPASSVEMASAPAALQRGAYLVQGLGHCGACHAPRNAWGAAAARLTGGDMPGQGWHAPSLVPGGPGQGTAEQTVALLKTGVSALGGVSGPMAAVVGNSLQHWTDADLQAAVFYLRSLPPALASAQPLYKTPQPPADAARSLRGAQLYETFCADCHGNAGQGVAGIYPALAGNATVLQPSALNLVQVIRHGAFGPSTAGNPRPFGMPPHNLADADLAALASHVRQAFGNNAGSVSELEVLHMR